MIEENKIYNEDCLKGMKRIPDKSVDLILTDLPYGVTTNKYDKKIPLKDLWEEYNRIIKDNGCILLFAQGKFFIELVNSNIKMFRYDLIWDKVLSSGFLNANRLPLRRHEQIAVFYKKLPTYNSQMSIGEPLHSRGINYKHKNFVNNNYGDYDRLEDIRKGSIEKYPTTILEFSKTHPSKAKHRTEKPVELLEYLIKTYSNEDELVLDSCIGSGSTAIACINTNRRFIGFELDKRYYEVANKRIEKETNRANAV